MRIAFFTDTFPPEVNGVANTVHGSARALAKKGNHVKVFTISRFSAAHLTQHYATGYEIATIPSIRLPIYLGVRATPPLGFALRKVSRFKPDVIHSHTPFSIGWEAVWAARLLGVPLIGTHHTFFDFYMKHVHLDYAWARRLSWKLTVGYYNRCDVVVSPTRSLADQLVANGLKRPYEIIANGIDTEFFAPASDRARIKDTLDLPGKVVIYMGRVSYEKSIDQVLRAFKLLVEQEPNAMLVVAGDGPDKVGLESLAKELGLGNRIRFTGFVNGNGLLEYLRASDVFLTASKSENMPLAILEAMAVGLPIIAVHSLGLSEIVEHGGNGYLLPPDDVEALSEHTEKLLHDNELRARFSASSRELSGRYSENMMAQHLEILYGRAIKQHTNA